MSEQTAAPDIHLPADSALWDIEQVVPYDRNPRLHSEAEVAKLAAGIMALGFNKPIEVDEERVILAGHRRLAAARFLGMKQVPVIQHSHLNEAEKRAYRIADNRLTLEGEWDRALLGEEMEAAATEGLDLLLTGFEQDEIDSIIADWERRNGGADADPGDGRGGATLAERFLVPPFSVLNAREGWWQSRKWSWIGLGIRSELGRGENSLGMSDACNEQMNGGHVYEDRKRKKDKAEAYDGGMGKRMQAIQKGKALAISSQDSLNAIMRQKKSGGVLLESNTTADPGFYAKKRAKEAELGRTLTTDEYLREHYEPDDSAIATGTSIFDPVLCEIAYRWFSPPGGMVFDPFAGGSVRGIVAARLGRRYVGIDLRPEQAAANEEQWAAIGGVGESVLPDEGDVEVKVSSKMARLAFHGCEPDYIAKVCHAACCHSSTSPTGTLITIHPSEQSKIEARGAVVENHMLQPRPGEKRCPFETDVHLCALHGTADKPFGCIASPFTLNSNGTLIVRNRYRLLPCYNEGPRLPAYVAFRASLDLIFGTDESARICKHLDDGGGDIIAKVPARNYAILVENDRAKHARSAAGGPEWIVGDARDTDALCGEVQADFVFSCPPYADLEVYSDDPRDLSNLDYPEFLRAYRDIILKACARLKENRFACFVVGDVRGTDGMYYNFVSDTIAAFREAGLALYNEAILVTAVGSLPIRAGRQFSKTRKLGKTHQNVLVFVKGDPRKATAACGEVEVDVPDEGSGETES